MNRAITTFLRNFRMSAPTPIQQAPRAGGPGPSRNRNRRRGGGGGGRGGRPQAAAADGDEAAPRLPTGPRAQQKSQAARQALPTPPESGVATPVAAPGSEKLAHLSDLRFADWVKSGTISETTGKGLKHEFATEVQAATMPVIMTGKDVLAQAKTGTGKTIAFLLPTIDRLAAINPPKNQTSILVISPTRELAMQIEVEAQQLLAHHPFKAQHVVGGTAMRSEVRRLREERADVLVATPGRLLDHLQNEGLAPRLAGLKYLILDEADRLLESGFRQELLKIFALLPPRETSPRQTLLFSATIPREVRDVAHVALLPSHEFVTTLKPEDNNTHQRVVQRVGVALIDDQLGLIARAVREDAALEGGGKVIVFLPTARATGLAFQVFKGLNLGGLPVWEIHSRKSQSQRTAAADAFRATGKGVLFSSDVSARGVDFPNVSLVIQAGLPASAEQYIHRLGRTARAGRDGQGLLILSPFETSFLRQRQIAALPLTELPLPGPAELGALRQEVDRALANVSDEVKAQAYSASLGYYKGSLRQIGWTPEILVQEMNRYAVQVLKYKGGTGEVPGLLAKTVGMMGLRGTHGLVIVKELPGSSGGRGGGRGGRGGRGGGGGGRGGAGRQQ